MTKKLTKQINTWYNIGTSVRGAIVKLFTDGEFGCESSMPAGSSMSSSNQCKSSSTWKLGSRVLLLTRRRRHMWLARWTLLQFFFRDWLWKLNISSPSVFCSKNETNRKVRSVNWKFESNNRQAISDNGRISRRSKMTLFCKFPSQPPKGQNLTTDPTASFRILRYSSFTGHLEAVCDWLDLRYCCFLGSLEQLAYQWL